MNRTFSLARAAGTTLAQVITPAPAGAMPRIHYLHVTSDKAASVLKFRVGKEVFVTTAQAAASQAVIALNAVTNLGNGETLAIFPADGSAPFIGVQSGAASGLNVTLVTNLAAILPAGSKVYRVVDHSQIPVAAASVERPTSGPGLFPIFTGQAERPIVLELDGTSACSINFGAGELVTN